MIRYMIFIIYILSISTIHGHPWPSMAIHGVLGELAFEEPQRVPGLRLRDAGPGEALLQALQTLQGAELLLGMALDINGVPYIDIG